MKKDTKNVGASIERSALRAKIRRLIKAGGTLDELLEWTYGRPARTSKKPGGLGKR